MKKYYGSEIAERLRHRLKTLYGNEAKPCFSRLLALVGRYGLLAASSVPRTLWSEKDALLIAYPGMISDAKGVPLRALKSFADANLRTCFSAIHLLPFFPYSSDDGFSVIHYRQVNPDVGTWEDVQAIGEHFQLMFDLVLNHVSRQSGWFEDFLTGTAPGRHYFIEAAANADVAAVVRPRTTPLLSPSQTRSGIKYVWTTFSEDQVDLNYANPDVLFEILDILLFYVGKGARIIRLDAIAYLWKRLGTPCIHLTETHEVVKIFRDVLRMIAPEVLLLTETNVPHPENIQYFGNGDEAHLVYQFPLPPLILHALVSEQASFLTKWASELQPPPPGCTFLNFTASHDGIGVRPLEGLVPPEETGRLLEHVSRRGGRISNRKTQDGKELPYELNITWFDAMGGARGESSAIHVQRFLCSQAIALALRGIPAVYFHSLTAAPNDLKELKKTGHNRAINRGKWRAEELQRQIKDPAGTAGSVFPRYGALLTIRRQHSAFHPDAAQRVLDLHPKLFVLLRRNASTGEQILAIHNVSSGEVRVAPQALQGVLPPKKSCTDLLSDGSYSLDAQKDLALAPFQATWLCWK